jgi:hypothetical protein
MEMRKITPEGYKALLQLGQQDEERSDDEVARLMAVAYTELSVTTFVNVFLASIDMFGRFDSDTAHVDCPVACIRAALAYQRAGGQFLTGE